ncbi:MAG: diacylglycerol/polyprenol kinase family protein [Candidatus Kariarchaeaceae archaeon]|jgi:dolichol kinase
MDFELQFWRTFILLAIPLALLLFAFVLRGREVENWVIRKYVHSVGLFAAGLYGAFIESLIEILVLAALLIVFGLLLSLPPIYFIQELTSMATRDGESQILVTVNGFSTFFGVVILVAVFFDIKWIFLASVYSVALGDGLGEFIGKPYGRHKYKIFSNKSIEGSLGVLLGSILGGLFSLLIFNVFTPQYFGLIILASFVVTIVEAFSVLFLDNLLMPVTYAFVLWTFTG